MKTIKGIFVLHAMMETSEDSYEEGEQPGSTIVWEDSNLGAFADGKALLEYFASSPPYVPKEEDCWSVFGNEGSSGARIDAEWTVDDDNNAANKEQLEQWRKGKLRLWTARLLLRVVVIAEAHEAGAEELVKLTGFQEV